MMKGDVFMFNRHSGVNKPYMGVSPAMMGPGANVMGTFKGKVTPGMAPVAPTAMGPYAPTAVSPAAMGPGMAPMAPFAPTAVSPAAIGPVPVSPTNVLPSTLAPTQVSPTQELVNTNVMNTVVPHVHPSHTTTVNQHVFTHKHYFPHTQSVVNQCCSQHVVCPGPGPLVSPVAMGPYCPPRPPFCC